MTTTSLKVLASATTADVYIYTYIGWDASSLKGFTEQLASIPPTVTEVTIHINSGGGDVFEGKAIQVAIDSLKDKRITTVVEGVAASMAAVLSQAGTVRKIHEGAFMMVHAPYTLTAGNAKELKQAVALLEAVEQSHKSYYMQRTKQAEEVVATWFEDDTWFTAEQALQAGLVDEIIPTPKIAALYEGHGFKNVPAGVQVLAETTPPADAPADATAEEATDTPACPKLAEEIEARIKVLEIVARLESASQ